MKWTICLYSFLEKPWSGHWWRSRRGGVIIGDIKIMISLLCKWQLKDIKCCRHCPCISRLIFERSTPSCRVCGLWHSFVKMNVSGAKKLNLALCTKSIKYGWNKVIRMLKMSTCIYEITYDCVIKCESIFEQNFWEQSKHPQLKPDKWRKWWAHCRQATENKHH